MPSRSRRWEIIGIGIGLAGIGLAVIGLPAWLAILLIVVGPSMVIYGLSFSGDDTAKGKAENEEEDWLRELHEFGEHVRVLTDKLHQAYQGFVASEPSAPETWKEAVEAARWPGGVPLQNNEPLSQWKGLNYRALPPESELVFRFAEALYPPPSQERPSLRERSTLPPTDYDVFHVARRDIKYYFELWGHRNDEVDGFAEFLESSVRSPYRWVVVLLAYLEIALATALELRTAPTVQGRHFWKLGDRWSRQ